MFDTMCAQETEPVPTFVASDLESIPPGPGLASVLASLNWDRLSGFDLVRALRAQQRQVSHYQAGSYWSINKIVAVYQDPNTTNEPKDFEQAAEGAAAEIGAALRLTRRSADIETGLALDLNRRLPSVFKALLDGRIDMRRARVLVDSTIHVPVAIAQDVVDTLLDDAALLTTGQLRHRIQKLCIDVNPDDAKERYDTSLEDRRLVVETNDSGTANLLGLDLPPHVVVAIKRRIHREAIRLRNAGDTRTLDQLRADIFLDILRQRHSKAHTGTADGGVHLDTTLDGLAGLADHSGDLNGYGPVVADIARQVAEHQTNTEWRWTLRDPDTGQPIDGGITRRRPTTGQRRKAETLNRTCVHPGCRMPAVDCDIDHTIPWADRKLTRTGDLAPMCRHHHTVRHTFDWTYQPLSNGDHLFTTPLGHTHTTSGKPP